LPEASTRENALPADQNVIQRLQTFVHHDRDFGSGTVLASIKWRSREPAHRRMVDGPARIHMDRYIGKASAELVFEGQLRLTEHYSGSKKQRRRRHFAG
jgi:hypothetical protein